MTEISAANILPSPSHGVTLAEAVRVWLLIALLSFGVPFPLIVLTAGALGFLGARAGRSEFALGSGHGSAGNDRDEARLLGEDLPAHASPSVGQSLRVAGGWLIPVVALVLVLGNDNVFSQMAVVTFDGTYVAVCRLVNCRTEW